MKLFKYRKLGLGSSIQYTKGTCIESTSINQYKFPAVLNLLLTNACKASLVINSMTIIYIESTCISELLFRSKVYHPAIESDLEGQHVTVLPFELGMYRV